MKKNNLSPYLFILSSLSLILFIGYKSNDTIKENDFSLTTKQVEDNINDSKKNEEIITNENSISDKYTDNIINDEFIENIALEEEELTSYDKENITINSIKIAQYIDTDQESKSYRDPIDKFETITTVHESVTKEIDYYPSFFVWSSTNTENTVLEDKNGNINPINLSMIIKHENNEIKKIDYQIPASTPRWREWTEINLTDFDNKILNGVWNVEIINNDNSEVLESRNFKLTQKEKEEEKQIVELKQISN